MGVDGAIADDESAVAGLGELMIVGDDDESDAVFGGKIEEDAHDIGAIFGIEITGGFVGEKHFRFVNDSSSDGDALLFAAGEFGGEVVGAVGQADALEGEQGRGGGIAAGDGTRDRDIFEGGEFREQVIILEHITDEGVAETCLFAAAKGVEVGTGDMDGAAFGAFEAGEGVEQGGFAGAAGAAEE